jgi:3-phosphoglycerate kinase
MSAFSAIKDKRRITAVLDCINALNEKDTLTLTGLGRGMKNTKTKVKLRISVIANACLKNSGNGCSECSEIRS